MNQGLFHQLAAGNPQLIDRLEGFPHFRAADLSVQGTPVEVQHFPDFLRLFLQKFNAESGDAQIDEMPQILRSGLLDGIVDRIPAPIIHPYRMGKPDPVPQADPVLLAGTAAVGIIRPLAQERAVHAVLRMVHRQVLMDDDFDPRRIRAAEQIGHLLDVQVIGRGDPGPALRKRAADRWLAIFREKSPISSG